MAKQRLRLLLRELGRGGVCELAPISFQLVMAPLDPRFLITGPTVPKTVFVDVAAS